MCTWPTRKASGWPKLGCPKGWTASPASTSWSAPTPPSRPRWRSGSRPIGACSSLPWWRPVTSSTRSTRCRRLATWIATRPAVPSPTPATPRCCLTWSALTATTTGPWPATAEGSRPSRCWPAPIRRWCGRGDARPTCCAPRCASSTRPPWWPLRNWPAPTRSKCCGSRPPRHSGRACRAPRSPALRRGGRQRRIDERSAEIQAALRSPQLQAPAAVATAMGASVSASVAVIAEMAAQTAHLAEELTSGFEQHPDAEVVRSLPGLGTILGARVLGEFGDEPNRYATPKCRKNYAGTSPITRASGTKKTVLARHVRNRRLADAIYLWAFASLTASPGARAYYDARRAAGDGHHQALRALGNRLVGILHGCLEHHSVYDETVAWGHRAENNLTEAA